MPLDRSKGEILEGMGDTYRVVPAAKWRELTRITTKYKVQSGTAFKIWVNRTRPIYEDAITLARAAFANAGALEPIIIDDSCILVQEYPDDNRVAFVFSRLIAGEEKVFGRGYDLTPQEVGWLVTTGRWQRPARTPVQAPLALPV